MAFGTQPLDAGGVPLWTPSAPGAKKLPPLLRIETPKLSWRRPPVTPPAPWPRTNKRYRRAVVNIIAGGQDRDHQLTFENHARYALACGAQYIVLREPKPEHAATSWKYRACDVAREFDQTLYLDADCVVTKWAPNVFERLPVGCWGAVNELPFISGAAAAECQRIFHESQRVIGLPEEPPRLSVNGGVLLLPPNASEIYRPDMLWTWLADQSCLSARLQAGQADYRLLDWRWNCCWMFAPRVWSTSKVFIRHRAGQQLFEGFEAKLAGISEDVAREGF